MEEELKRIGLRLNMELLKMVDDYRITVPGAPDRTKAIRMMIEIAFKLHKQNQGQD